MRTRLQLPQLATERASSRVAGPRLALPPRTPLLQRQADPAPGTGSPVGMDDVPASTCPSWYQDPQSISKVAAQKYIIDELHRPAPPPITIDCDAPRWNGAYRCRVQFQTTSLLPAPFQPPASVKVFVFPDKVIVTAEPFVSLDGTPNEPLCTYDYSCDDPKQLVLTLRGCKRGKAAPKAPGTTP